MHCGRRCPIWGTNKLKSGQMESHRRSVLTLSLSTGSYSVPPRGLRPASLLCPWDAPGRNTGVVAMPSSGGSSQHGDQTWVSRVSCVGRWILYHWATGDRDPKFCTHPLVTKLSLYWGLLPCSVFFFFLKKNFFFALWIKHRSTFTSY